jgi:hypothetical protein
MPCYDFSKFHPSCAVRGLVYLPDGLHVYCLTCGVTANVEAISGKISPEEACKVGSVDRVIQGDQSFNVNKGEVIKQ